MRFTHLARRNHSALRPVLAAFLTAMLVFSSLPAVQAADPASGTLNPTSGASVAWAGTAPGGTSLNGEGSCVEGETCEYFVLTLAGQPSDWTGKVARIELHWTVPGVDYDFYVHQGSPNVEPRNAIRHEISVT